MIGRLNVGKSLNIVSHISNTFCSKKNNLSVSSTTRHTKRVHTIHLVQLTPRIEPNCIDTRGSDAPFAAIY